MLGIRNLLVVYCDYGRLGNRIHTHANALAWCIENNYNLINISFTEYAGLFHNCSVHKYIMSHQNKHLVFNILSSKLLIHFLKRLLLSEKWLVKLSWLINPITSAKRDFLDQADLSKNINHNKINLINYWDINCNNLIQLHQKLIRFHFTPNNSFVDSAKKIIHSLRSKYDCLVGIHARRGDYAQYLNGIHYHSWETYLNWTIETKIALKLSGEKNIGFIICSDENIVFSIFKNYPVHFSNSKNLMVDLHTLSLCDYNLGPPSSYGTWVSWYGNVPRLVLKKDLSIHCLSQFSICSHC